MNHIMPEPIRLEMYPTSCEFVKFVSHFWSSSLNLIGYGGNKIRHDQKTLTHPLSGARFGEDSLVLQGRPRTQGTSSPYLGPRLAVGFFEAAGGGGGVEDCKFEQDRPGAGR